MTQVESSNIDSVGYDKEDLTLYIKFKNNTTYTYSKVPEKIYGSLMEAESVGKYLNQYVKGVFDFAKLNTKQSS